MILQFNLLSFLEHFYPYFFFPDDTYMLLEPRQETPPLVLLLIYLFIYWPSTTPSFWERRKPGTVFRFPKMSCLHLQNQLLYMFG